jgi:hypothetical protein
MLSEDDQFNSNPAVGTIAYRLPSLSTLFGKPMEDFDDFDTMTFDLKVINPDIEGESVTLGCAVLTNCQVVYTRHYSPTVFYVNPPVVYSGAGVDIWFNPKSIMDLIVDLPTDDIPFINFKFNNALVNFENYVDD